MQNFWKKAKEGITNVALLVWQLPQLFVGLIVAFYFHLNKCSYKKYKDATVVCSYKMRGGMSLGKWIFLSESYSELSLLHEYGHCIQSKYLGPLYLIVIGIPSIIHAALNNIIGCCRKHESGYYHFYTEKWSNDLVGLTTNKYGRLVLKDPE